MMDRVGGGSTFLVLCSVFTCPPRVWAAGGLCSCPKDCVVAGQACCSTWCTVMCCCLPLNNLGGAGVAPFPSGGRHPVGRVAVAQAAQMGLIRTSG